MKLSAFGNELNYKYDFSVDMIFSVYFSNFVCYSDDMHKWKVNKLFSKKNLIHNSVTVTLQKNNFRTFLRKKISFY